MLFSLFGFMKIIDSKDVKAGPVPATQYKAEGFCPDLGAGCFHLDPVVIK